MMRPKAVIDLGTNTFHLLVADYRNNLLLTVHRQRYFVKLARAGIDQISASAMVDARTSAEHFRQILDQHDVKDVSVLGTAALRRARNAGELNKQLEAILGHPVELINGHREAQLIAKGVLTLLNDKPGQHLIMDIGGGSVEFIQVVNGQTIYHTSLPMGVAILHNRFHIHDPILPQEILAMEEYIDAQIQPLLDHLNSNPVVHLIGAAGIYEVLSQRKEDQELPALGNITLERLKKLLSTLKVMPIAERECFEEIPSERADLIVSALLLINRIILQTQPKHVTVSPYAMKEGRLLEMFSDSAHSSSAPD